MDQEVQCSLNEELISSTPCQSDDEEDIVEPESDSDSEDNEEADPSYDEHEEREDCAEDDCFIDG